MIVDPRHVEYCTHENKRRRHRDPIKRAFSRSSHDAALLALLVLVPAVAVVVDAAVIAAEDVERVERVGKSGSWHSRENARGRDGATECVAVIDLDANRALRDLARVLIDVLAEVVELRSGQGEVSGNGARSNARTDAPCP